MLLLTEYQRLKINHEKAVQLRVARATLGSSVIRVFALDTRPDLIKAFDRIPVRELRAITGDDAFRVWFELHLDAVARVIARRNAGNARIQPGAKWGHSTKVLTIFLREMVSHTRLFRDDEVPRIERLLYVPLDSHRRSCGLAGGLLVKRRSRIREIDTPLERQPHVGSSHPGGVVYPSRSPQLSSNHTLGTPASRAAAPRAVCTW